MTTTTKTNTTNNVVKINRKSGGSINKSVSFDLVSYGNMNSLDKTIFYKSHHFTFSVSVNPSYLSYDKKQHSVFNWTMYYQQQNKNKTYRQQCNYISVDETNIDNLIGKEQRIQIENETINELVNELQGALVAINNKQLNRNA